MKKRFAAAVLAAAVTFMPATAFAGEYYGNNPLPDIRYSDYTIEPVSAEEFDAAAAALRNAASGGGFMQLMQLADAFDTINSLAERQARAYTLAYIQSSQHNTVENNKRIDELYASATDMASKALKLITELADTPVFAGTLASLLGGEDMLKEMLNDQPSDKYFELSNREQELVSEYRINSPDAMTFTDENGKEYTLYSLYEEMDAIAKSIEIGELTDDTEIAARLAHISELATSAQAKSSEKLGKVFKQLVDVRTEIAAEEGYSNYYDYAYNEIYFRDFDSADTADFRNAVKKYIAPLFAIYSNYLSSDYTQFSSWNNEKIISETGSTLESINPELKESFDFMNERRFLDICEDKDRITQGSAYTMSIPGSASPFTFISTVDMNPVYTYSTLIHEFGHYNAILRSGADSELTFDELFSDESAESIDLQEVYSQGLELLSADKYEDRFTLYDSSALYMDRLFSILDTILKGCVYDEWQEAVYKNPGMSVEEINTRYKGISTQYGMDSNPADWIFVPHNFEQPMYYISYAVSAAAALDLWMQSIDDYDGAVDKYMRLTASSRGDFRETLRKAGFDDIFDEKQMIKIAGTLDSFYRGGYEDVASDSWYADSVRLTKPFFDNGDSRLFRPEDTATRREAANTIGMLNEYTTGRESAGTTEFADAPNSPLISWAADNGIITGYNATTFGADDTLTREQAVTILHRYCNQEGLAANTRSDQGYDRFDDADSVSDWADEAFEWAVNSGIISGRDNNDGIFLAPHEPVKRAELAEMISNMSYTTNLRKTRG